DALVLATGFASTQQPYADLVRGEHGTLAEHWAQGMTSFGSTVVAGFPNMFVIDGPNASLGHNSSVLMMEEQAKYVVRTLRQAQGPAGLAQGPAGLGQGPAGLGQGPGRPAERPRVLRVDPAAEAAYTAEIDRA